VHREKKRLSPTANVEKDSESDDGSSISKREATEKCRPLLVYKSHGQW
jgi:hypothetical protein